MAKDYCEYCNEIKDNSFGMYDGPQDSCFTCLSCRIKEERLRIKMHSDELNLLLSLQNQEKANQPERLNPETPQKGDAIV